MSEHTWFAPLIVNFVITEQDMNVKSSNSGKEVANKDRGLEAKSSNHSLFHCNKKHK
jgi:hypothetical protein